MDKIEYLSRCDNCLDFVLPELIEWKKEGVYLIRICLKCIENYERDK